jgi:hypothetical protein
MGYFIVFQVLQFQAKEEIKNAIKNQLSDESLVVLTLTEDEENELHWFEDGEEFMYNDMMYDVVRKAQKGKLIYYYCINDVKEKELFASLNDHIQNHVKNDLSSNKKTKSLLEKLLDEYLYAKELSMAGSDCIQISYCTVSERLNTLTMDILVPPPKSVS